MCACCRIYLLSLRMCSCVCFSLHTRFFPSLNIRIFPITFSLLRRLSGLRVRKPGSPLTNSLGGCASEREMKLKWKDRVQEEATISFSFFFFLFSFFRFQPLAPLGSPGFVPMTNDGIFFKCGAALSLSLSYSLSLSLSLSHSLTLSLSLYHSLFHSSHLCFLPYSNAKRCLRNFPPVHFRWTRLPIFFFFAAGAKFIFFRTRSHCGHLTLTAPLLPPPSGSWTSLSRFCFNCLNRIPRFSSSQAHSTCLRDHSLKARTTSSCKSLSHFFLLLLFWTKKNNCCFCGEGLSWVCINFVRVCVCVCVCACVYIRLGSSEIIVQSQIVSIWRRLKKARGRNR